MRVSRFKLGRWFVPYVLISLVGCSSEEVADAPGTDADQAGEDVDDQQLPRSDATLPADLMRLTVSESVGGFPHGAHGAVVCSQCHTSVAGHATHESVGCVDCHQGSAWLGERVVFARNECLSCHHSPDQASACEQCHDSGPAPVARTENLHLSVWPAPRSRILPFDHAVHQTVDCAQCHTGGVLKKFEQGCASCHQDHHQPMATCATCHSDVPLETHDLESHLGCGGAQCHQDALPLEAERSRSTCLTCHTAQVDHEPGGDCATCHVLGERGAASLRSGALHR